ncbi:MAG: VanZ family protein [Bacteroidales bacterium]|nr:VanZ family protein [Bacteroidales bacterium]
MVKKNIFSILVALIIMYLSLANSDTFEEVSIFNIPFVDKIMHFGMYFGLMSVIIFEYRKTLKSTGSLFLIALIPFFYGILMEILQSTLTTSRFASFYDILFNSAGILVSLLLWLWIKPLIKETIR